MWSHVVCTREAESGSWSAWCVHTQQELPGRGRSADLAFQASSAGRSQALVSATEVILFLILLLFLFSYYP